MPSKIPAKTRPSLFGRTLRLGAALALAGTPGTLPAQHAIVLDTDQSAPMQVDPACPTLARTAIHTGLSLDGLEDAVSDLEGVAMRPVSISATTHPDTGASSFDLISVADEYGDSSLWTISIGHGGAVIEDMMDNIANIRPAAIDAYLDENGDRAYAVAWVVDGTPARVSVGVDADDLAAADATNQGLATPFRPVWIDGFHDGTETLYSAIWVQDGVSGRMDVEPLLAEAADDNWKDATDAGLRMLRLTQFRVNDESGEGTQEATRRMAVWQQDDPACAGDIWAGFTLEPQDAFEITATAQIERGGIHTVVDGEISVEMDDLPGLLYVGAGAGGIWNDLLRIVPGGTPEDGTLAVLRLWPTGSPVRIRDVHMPTFEPDGIFVPEDGNIRLRRWNAGSGVSDAEVDGHPDCVTAALLSGCTGQAMDLTTFHSRIALRWDADEEVWREARREGLLPDRYLPLATDAFEDANGRVIASTWAGRNARQVQTAAHFPEGQLDSADQTLHASLPDFDTAIEDFMSDRLIPHATFAIARDGRVVTARHYSVIPGRFTVHNTLRADAPFRLASISKAVTAVAMLRLVEEGLVELDDPLTEIPGVMELIGEDWPMIDIARITPRLLLMHLGGWDRDIHEEPALGRDFEICDAMPGGLPMTMEGMLGFASTEPVAWQPDIKFAYSNLGYTLLGRVIEAVSGQAYDDYVLEEVLPSQVAGRFHMSPREVPLGTDGQEGWRPGFNVGNPVGLSVFGPAGTEGHGLRNSCTPSHARRVLMTGGTSNDGLMDSHGGWVSDALATARFFSLLSDLVPEEYFREMANPPARNETRIRLGGAGAPVVDYTFRLGRAVHPAGVTGVDLAGLPLGSEIRVGLGYATFGAIRFTLAAPATGDGVTLSATYSVPGVVNAPLEINDGTEGLTQSGVITFARPEDWTTEATGAFGDAQRFWVNLRIEALDAAPPVIRRITAGAPADRGLAFQTSASQWQLGVNGYAPVGGQNTLVGQESHTSAAILSSVSVGGVDLLTIDKKSAGSFIPGEALGHVGPTDPAIVEIGRVAERREWPSLVDLRHGGALPGVDTRAILRADGTAWALLLGQRSSGAPFYVKGGDGALEAAIQSLLDGLGPADWPGWDIAPN